MGKFGFLSSLVFLFPAWMLTATAGTNLETGPETGFRNYFALELEGSASYYLFTLTPEVHQANMTPNGRDLRIVDANGKLVPYAFGGEIETPKEAPKEIPRFLRPAPWFPLPLAQNGKKVLDGFVIAADGTLRSRETQVEGEHRGGDIIDLSGFAPKDGKNAPVLNAIFIRLGTPAGGTGEYLGAVEVLASDDLQNWSPLTTAQLLRLDHLGQRLEQERIDLADYSLPAGSPRYLQLRWRGAPPLIAAIEAELFMPPDEAGSGQARQAQCQKPGECRLWLEKLPGQMPTAGEVFFDTGGAFPVDRLRFHLPRPNTVTPVEIYSRASENLPWRLIGMETLYRLQGPDGNEQETPEIRIATNRDRFWRMAVASDTATASGEAPKPRQRFRKTIAASDSRNDKTVNNGGAESQEFGGLPLLSAGWRPETITFLAHGAPPFLLAVGNPQATDASIPLAQLLVGDKPYLAAAQVGAAQPPPANAPVVAVASPPPEKWGEQSRRAILWGVLLATVALLAFMAWKLAKRLPPEEGGEEDGRR